MTVAIVHDKRRITTTGENAGKYPIKIRLTYKGEGKTWIQKLFPTGIYATHEEYKKITGNPGKHRELQDKQTAVFALYEKGKAIVKANRFVDSETFANQLTAKGSYKDPLGFMMAYAEELDDNGQVGTADYYRLAHSSWKEFAKEKCGGVLTFGSVTPELLMKYENWMIGRGRSITTVGMYAIAMRKSFNIARSDKHRVIPQEVYPFGDGKYVIPTSKGRKISLNEERKNKLLKYATLKIQARKGVDFWKLSYFSNGMNMADVCHLKFKNLPEDLIIFDRTKTTKTQRKKVSIVAIKRAEVTEIIERWGNKPGNPNEYVFPILREGLTPKQVKEKIRDFVWEINKGLEIACNDLNIPKITTYSARHTFATIARNNGASTEFIQEALGHSDSKTTKAYLDSFDLEAKKKVANSL